MSVAYRNTLLKAIINLDSFLEDLNLDIVNLAMNGEFAEVDELFEEGDVVRLNLGDFVDADDQNIQKLVHVFYVISEIKNTLLNTNAIADEEIRIAIEEPDNEGDDFLPF